MAGPMEPIELMDPMAPAPGEPKSYPLHEEIKEFRRDWLRDFSKFELLLNSGEIDLNEQDADGQTPLFLAVDVRLIPAIEILISKGVNLNLSTKKHMTPLHSAVSRRFILGVNLLLDAGADPHLLDWYGETPLHQAAKDGNAALVTLLLEKGAKNYPGYRGNTPLHDACGGLRKEVVCIMLRNKIDKVLTPNNYGIAPLDLFIHSAIGYSSKRPVVTNQRKEFKRVIVKALDSKDLIMVEAMFRFNDYFAVADKFLSESDFTDFLYNACECENLAAAKFLIENGAKVSNFSESKKVRMSPLGVSISLDNDALVNLLIQKGVDINKRLTSTKTPLHLAASLPRSTIARTLIIRGADIDAQDKDGRTPIYYVETIEMAEFFLEFGGRLSLDVLKYLKTKRETVARDHIMVLFKRAIIATNVAFIHITGAPAIQYPDDPCDIQYKLDCKHEFERFYARSFVSAVGLYYASTLMLEKWERWKIWGYHDKVFKVLYSLECEKEYPKCTGILRGKYWILKSKSGAGNYPPDITPDYLIKAFKPHPSLPKTEWY